tara:strand:+ start:1319 stop:1561 length:243 start_codon:yes stop_codon:yes gene_type:complete
MYYLIKTFETEEARFNATKEADQAIPIYWSDDNCNIDVDDIDASIINPINPVAVASDHVIRMWSFRQTKAEEKEMQDVEK